MDKSVVSGGISTIAFMGILDFFAMERVESQQVETNKELS